jgi:hypothetical protein
VLVHVAEGSLAGGALRVPLRFRRTALEYPGFRAAKDF